MGRSALWGSELGRWNVAVRSTKRPGLHWVVHIQTGEIQVFQQHGLVQIVIVRIRPGKYRSVLNTKDWLVSVCSEPASFNVGVSSPPWGIRIRRVRTRQMKCRSEINTKGWSWPGGSETGQGNVGVSSTTWMVCIGIMRTRQGKCRNEFNTTGGFASCCSEPRKCEWVQQHGVVPIAIFRTRPKKCRSEVNTMRWSASGCSELGMWNVEVSATTRADLHPYCQNLDG